VAGKWRNKSQRGLFLICVLLSEDEHVFIIFYYLNWKIEIETIFTLNPQLLIGPPPTNGTPPTKSHQTVRIFKYIEIFIYFSTVCLIAP